MSISGSYHCWKFPGTTSIVEIGAVLKTGAGVRLTTIDMVHSTCLLFVPIAVIFIEILKPTKDAAPAEPL